MRKRIKIPSKAIEVFHSCYTVMPNGCWVVDFNFPHVGCAGGYANISVDGFSIKAHRLSHIIYHGAIPEGMFVLHSCHKPRCVNPEHLRAGTHLENMEDMVEAGRHSNNHTRPFASAQVRELATILKDTSMDDKELGEMFGVSPGTIYCIRTGRSWSHVTGIQRA